MTTPARRRPPPPYLSLPALGLVFAGGVAGTAARYLLTGLVPRWGGWPAAIFAVNVSGAFLLGLLLEGLARRGSDRGGRRQLRLLLGTGFCGAFTTYSALAVDTELLLRRVHVALAAGYALGTVVLGFGASALGVWVGSRTRGGAAGQVAR